MVEMIIHTLHRNLLPPTGGVARLAGLRKAAAVWIFMAVRTLIKGNPNVLRFAVGSVRVALRALHLRMQTGQRIARLRVIELAHRDRLPVLEVVACLAGWA